MKILLKLAIFVVCMPISHVHAATQPAGPNVVLVLMDNLGWGEPGVYGGGILRGAPTPRIDRLASEGMRLLNFNVEAQCTPSRAALLTGRYAIRSGNGTVPIFSPIYGLVQWERTLAEVLSDAGYATAINGKWHLGHTEGRFPTDQGFDEWYGIPNSSDESFWPANPRYRPDSDPFAGPSYIMESRKGEEPTKLRVAQRAEFNALRPKGSSVPIAWSTAPGPRTEEISSGPTGRPFDADWRRTAGPLGLKGSFGAVVFPGPLSQAIGTAGPLGRNTATPHRAAMRSSLLRQGTATRFDWVAGEARAKCPRGEPQASFND